MQLAPIVQRFLTTVGIAPERLPRELRRPAPFQQTVVDVDELVRWVAREQPRFTLDRYDPLLARVREESLRAASIDTSATAGALLRGPLEDTLHLGALARVAALVAARAPEADEAVQAIAPLLTEARPIARTATLTLGQIGRLEGPVGRRARALLEDALHGAIAHAHDLGIDYAEAVTGRVIDLVGVLGSLAPHREGLTQRLSALATEVPPFAQQFYVVAYLAALGAAETGPYLDEVHARLREAANDSELGVRALAVEAIAGHPALADELDEALTDASELVRTAAALAIAELGVASEVAAAELADMIELGEPEEILAAAHALVSCGRALPAGSIDEIDDPLVQATVRALEQPDDERFLALAHAYGQWDPEGYEEIDERVRPLTILVETLQSMSPVRAAQHLTSFAAGEPDTDTIGEAFYHALDDSETIPSELATAGRPLLDVLEAGTDEERLALVALVAARLYPDDPRLEALLIAQTAPPVTLIALAALDSISAAAVQPTLSLLALDEGDDDGIASLAIAALARCEASAAGELAAALARHLDDGDPLAEPAHAALLELVARGALD